MASGVLGKSNPAAATWVDLYTPANGTIGTALVSMCNALKSAPATIRLAVVAAPGTAPGSTDYLVFDDWMLQVGPVVLSGTQTLRCYASTANIAFVAMGQEA